MPVQSKKNQYQGVNAHLNSWLQGQGGWKDFHNASMTYLMTALKAQLLPMGYTAAMEQSLQIWRPDFTVGKPISDITIYDMDSVRATESRQTYLQEPGAVVLTLPEALGIVDVDETQYWSIGVYPFAFGKSERGEPVAWIELLSPSNKPGGGSDAERYRDKRKDLLDSGIVLVEVDYLHETAPTIEGVPDYRFGGTHPFRIIVFDPHPDLLSGKSAIFAFDVDQPIPTVVIPLSGNDVLKLDFNAPYQRLYEEALYGLEWVDYSQLPINFDRYNADDQARIVNRMLAVLNAAKNGMELEADSFEAGSLPLDNALEQLKSYQHE